MKNKLHVVGSVTMLAALMLVGSGCGTIFAVGSDASGNVETPEAPYSKYRIPRVYSGCACELAYLRVGGETAGVVALDLPATFAGDTLALPYTIPRQIKYGDLWPGHRIARQVREKKSHYE